MGQAQLYQDYCLGLEEMSPNSGTALEYSSDIVWATDLSLHALM